MAAPMIARVTGSSVKSSKIASAFGSNLFSSLRNLCVSLRLCGATTASSCPHRRFALRHDRAQRHVLSLAWVIAELELDGAFGQGLVADGEADGDADQVGVLELHAGALVAVVHEDVEAGGGEVLG